MLSVGNFKGSAQVIDIIFVVKIHISYYFCQKKPHNAIFWCKVGENAILGLPWAKMVRICFFMINILSCMMVQFFLGNYNLKFGVNG